MEMLNLVFDLTSLDLLDFVAGAGLVGVFLYGRMMLTNKKEKSLDTRIAVVSKKYKDKYAEFAPVIQSLEEKAEELAVDFGLNFPEQNYRTGQYSQKILVWQSYLKTMLKNTAKIDSGSIDKEAIDQLEAELDSLCESFKKDCLYIESEIREFQGRIKSNLLTRKDLMSRRDYVRDNLATIEKAYSLAEQNFDRILLAEMPPLLDKAREAYKQIHGKVPLFVYSVNRYSGSGNLYETAEKTLAKAATALTQVIRYDAVAKKETSRYRNVLKRYPPRNAMEKELHDEALLSLMDAENMIYDSGNPPALFRDITEPFLQYVAYRQSAAKTSTEAKKRVAS